MRQRKGESREEYLERARLRSREYYAQNREAHHAATNRYREAHREKVYGSEKVLREKRKRMATDERKELVYELARARESMRLSQSDIAALLGISPSMVSFYENFTQIPTAGRLQQWCRLLGVKYRQTAPLKEEYYHA